MNTLDDAMLKAITEFAKANGKKWKWALWQVWAQGNYCDFDGTENYGDLQRIRNQFGPEFLDTFHLPTA